MPQICTEPRSGKMQRYSRTRICRCEIKLHRVVLAKPRMPSSVSPPQQVLAKDLPTVSFRMRSGDALQKADLTRPKCRPKAYIQRLRPKDLRAGEKVLSASGSRARPISPTSSVEKIHPIFVGRTQAYSPKKTCFFNAGMIILSSVLNFLKYCCELVFVRAVSCTASRQCQYKAARVKQCRIVNNISGHCHLRPRWRSRVEERLRQDISLSRA